MQVSVPGTGISYRKEEAWAAPAAGDEGTAPSSPAGALRFVILGIVLTIIAIVLFAALTR